MISTGVLIYESEMSDAIALSAHSGDKGSESRVLSDSEAKLMLNPSFSTSLEQSLRANNFEIK